MHETLTHLSEKIADFSKDFKRGKVGENHVAKLLGTDRVPEDLDAGDWIKETLSGDTFIEVKTDEMYDKTGNIAIELLDVLSKSTVGTGVAKSVNKGKPVIYVQAMGSSGQYAVYEAEAMFSYISSNGRNAFTKLVSVLNRGKQGGKYAGNYHTVNGIIRVEKVPCVSIVSEHELRNHVSNMKPTVSHQWSTSDIHATLESLVDSFGFSDDERYMNGKLNIKGQVAVAEKDVPKVLRRKSLSDGASRERVVTA